ncbi:MAG TPA: HypC/HybG/HupF family hydrogenase formation chaperone [Thermoplasmatales archaeon]|nr:HypC/HybG/HupF family hydrogenase formation chaperone [Thermoplasmatales archaeon]HEX08197.1 HypC/HybG/HupF family hydrogenase formation chaperone [Thermoplasmatales archaeon]
MCLAVPARVTKILEERGYALVDYGGGVTRKVNISLVSVKEGDYVMIHAGFAIEKLDEERAKETINIFKEILSME